MIHILLCTLGIAIQERYSRSKRGRLYIFLQKVIRILPTNMPLEILKLNVGGQMFKIERSSLVKYPTSKLTQLNTDSPSYIAETGEHFFDVDPRYMNIILAAYRGHIDFNDGINVISLVTELEFWGLDISVLSNDARNKYIAELNLLSLLSSCNPEPDNTWRVRLFLLLEAPRSSLLAMIWAILFHGAILTSILLFMAETTLVTREDDWSDIAMVENATTKFEHFDLPVAFVIVEALLTLGLCTEHVFRFILTNSRREFYKSFFNVVDMLSAFPVMMVYLLDFIHFLIGGLIVGSFALIHWFYFTLHCLILFRLFRFLKFAFNFMSARIVLISVLSSLKQLCTWCVCLFIIMVLFANFIFFAEKNSPYAQFDSSFETLWLAMVTLTTVGYGDLVPVTKLGRLVGGALLVVTIPLLSVAMAVVTSHFMRVQRLSRSISAANNEEMNKFHSRVKVILKDLEEKKAMMAAN